jgi:enoyl-CoA hydratase/carnithine racemase
VSEPRVRIEVADHVAVVTLTRADKHNALDVPMFEAIVDAAQRLMSEPGVRAVVLHGDGPSFCSGIDVVSVMASSSGGLDGLTDPLRGEVPNWFQRAAYDWIRLPVPVIAALHGNCLGGGLQIALAADIRVATPDARLSVMEIKWGLIPDMSITRTLPRLVGIDVAKELTYTGRVLSGSEAGELRLVTHVVEDPLAAARGLAAEIAGKSPDAVRGAKRLLDEAWTGSAEETLSLEASIQLGLVGSPNQLAAVSAGLGWMSELLVGATQGAVAATGLSQFFVGIVLVPIIGNAAEHSSAVLLARKGRMDLALGIALGSTVQVALLVAPLLVFAGLLLGQPMDLAFSPFEITGVALAVWIASVIVQDGESNWLEGAFLLLVYGVLGVAFYFF